MQVNKNKSPGELLQDLSQTVSHNEYKSRIKLSKRTITISNLYLTVEEMFTSVPTIF